MKINRLYLETSTEYNQRVYSGVFDGDDKLKTKLKKNKHYKGKKKEST